MLRTIVALLSTILRFLIPSVLAIFFSRWFAVLCVTRE